MGNKLKADIVVGFCFIFAAVAFFIPSLKLGIVGPEAIAGPGPGFFPAVCSVFTAFFGMWIILDAVKKGSADFFGTDLEQRSNFKIIAFVTAIFVAFVLIWAYADFFLATALLCLAFNKAFGRSLKFNVIFTLLYVVLLYGVFVMLLDVRFDI